MILLAGALGMVVVSVTAGAFGFEVVRLLAGAFGMVVVSVTAVAASSFMLQAKKWVKGWG